MIEQLNISKAIEDFVHPTVYTGVKPIFLVAEELATEHRVGDIVEAVWIGINSSKEFSYITKFAVSGKITLGKYHQADETELFRGRVALVNDKNLENVVLHRNTLAQIKELKIKRAKLLDEIKRDFNSLFNLFLEKKELYVFEKKSGEWDQELFSDLDINTPYRVISLDKKSTELHLYLENSKRGESKKHLNSDKLYGYFIGSLADLAGLKLKNRSYAINISSLQNDAKATIKRVEWLELNDLHVREITQKLPKHPFEEYFKYVKKENVRKLDVSSSLVEILKKIILKHMPENNTPLGMEYILVDKLLYLFHMIISRDEALHALEMCDILYEPPGIILGYSGEHKSPPKYLVPISHVAYAYQNIPNFMTLCGSFSDEK